MKKKIFLENGSYGIFVGVFFESISSINDVGQGWGKGKTRG